MLSFPFPFSVEEHGLVHISPNPKIIHLTSRLVPAYRDIYMENFPWMAKRGRTEKYRRRLHRFRW